MTADRRRLAPLLLIAVGGAVLLGCIPIPGPYTNASGDRRPERKIGPPGSGAIVEVGRSTRERAVRVFGGPSLVSADGRVYAFGYRIVTGYLVWPLCFSADRGTSDRYLGLRFDGNGVLAEAEVTKDPAALEAWSGEELKSPQAWREDKP